MCERQNTIKTVESQLTEIHICRDCHRTFVIDKPRRAARLAESRDSADSLEHARRREEPRAETRLSQRWERRHTNGWVAIVNLKHTGGLYSASAQVAGLPPPQLAHLVGDLSSAQQKADENVPPHDCNCPGWPSGKKQKEE
jgi:hypothetical protein